MLVELTMPDGAKLLLNLDCVARVEPISGGPGRSRIFSRDGSGFALLYLDVMETLGQILDKQNPQP